MKYSNPRIDRLKELLRLEEQRAELQSQVDALTEQMHSLRDSLFDEAAAANGNAARRPKGETTRQTTRSEAAAPKARGTKNRRQKRGALKEQIVSALQAAGEAGVKVTELAKALAIKPVNIHSWFHSAVSRYPEIKKLQGGHYRLTGDGGRLVNAEKEEEETSSSSAKRSRGKAARSSARRGRAADAEGRSPSRRGELSSRILAEMEAAGAEGINVKDLSEKIGTPYKNIYVWFATTGKKNAKIKKLGPASYKLG